LERVINTMMCGENLPNRAGGAGQFTSSFLERWVFVQIIQDRERSRGTSQLLRRVVTNFKDFLDDFWIHRRRRVFGDTGLSLQNFLAFQRRATDAFDPVFHPGF
jgi:hypothetical protein